MSRKKIIPYSKRWNELAMREAKQFAPPMFPCARCNYPVVSGYCCTFCGCDSPNHWTEEDEKELQAIQKQQKMERN